MSGKNKILSDIMKTCRTQTFRNVLKNSNKIQLFLRNISPLFLRAEFTPFAINKCFSARQLELNLCYLLSIKLVLPLK